MKPCLFKKIVQMLFALVVVNISMSVPVFAQSETNETQQQPSSDAKTPEILLNDLEQNERALYALFNTLNSSDENDVICSAITVEKIETKTQLCEPVFLEGIRQEVDAELAKNAKAQTSFFGRIRNTFQSPEERAERLLRNKASVRVQDLQKEIESLAIVHPNLFAQLMTIGEIQREYLQLIQVERRSSSYLMRQNEAFHSHNVSQPSRPQLTLSAPQPGYTQPTLNYGYRGPLAR